MKKLVVILVIFGLSYAASAQGMGLGPVLGIHKAQDAESTNLLGGVALRMKLNKAIGIEGAIMVRSEDYVGDAVQVTNYPVMVTGMFYPVPIAYGAVGVGWYNTRVDYQFEALEAVDDFVEPGDETLQEFGWHFGGGVELPIGPNMSIAGDIRYVFLNYDLEQVPGTDEIESDFFYIDVALFFGL